MNYFYITGWIISIAVKKREKKNEHRVRNTYLASYEYVPYANDVASHISHLEQNRWLYIAS